MLSRSISAREQDPRPDAEEDETVIPSGRVVTTLRTSAVRSPSGSSTWGTSRSTLKPVGKPAEWMVGWAVALGANGRLSHPSKTNGVPSSSLVNVRVSKTPRFSQESPRIVNDAGVSAQDVGMLRKGTRGNWDWMGVLGSMPTLRAERSASCEVSAGTPQNVSLIDWIAFASEMA